MFGTDSLYTHGRSPLRNSQDKGHSLLLHISLCQGSCVRTHAVHWHLLGLILYLRHNITEAKIQFLVDTMPCPGSKGRRVRADLVNKLSAIDAEYRNIAFI